MPQGRYESSLIIKSHPVQSERDLEKLPIPNPQTAGRIPLAMRFARLQAENGLPVFFSSRSPFTLAANICGLENFCRWMIRNPDLCRELMRRALEHILNVLSYWIETFGADKIFVWMSNPSESNQVISPKHMVAFALPYHLEYHERLKEMGIKRFGFHLCGDQNLNLPCLAEADPRPRPSVLSFGHEVPIETAAKYYPRDIIFGDLGPNQFQVAAPQRIYELCREIIIQGKRAPGGFMLAPGCGIPATAPPVKVFAITYSEYDFWRYLCCPSYGVALIIRTSAGLPDALNFVGSFRVITHTGRKRPCGVFFHRSFSSGSHHSPFHHQVPAQAAGGPGLPPG